MNIAIIAHDKKKELMVQFCMAYCGILAKHHLCATGTTGKFVQDATGLKIEKFLAGMQGGEQQISARVSYDEIDMVLFFRDPNSNSEYEPDVHELARLCDMHNVPIATNVATAEMLIFGLDRGDLDYRDILREQRKSESVH
ncbi:MAG: methylglyoxal synthase [Butyricicoccaceae bacterium]